MATQEFTPTGGSPREADDSNSIKSAIEAAVDEHAGDAEPDEEGEEEQPESGSEEGKPEGDKQPEIKDPKEGDDKTVEAKKDGDKTVEDDKKADDKKADDKKTDPTATWSAKDKETFKTLPKPAQDFLLDRHRSMEADYTRKTQDTAALRKDYEAVDQIFTPQRENLKKAGLTASAVIQGWANAELALMSGKGLDLLPGVAKAYKIDPVKLAHRILVEGGIADPAKAFEELTAQIKAQPAALVLPPEVQAKLDKLDRVAAHVEGQQRQHADAEVTRINNELEAFKVATDDKGAALHPYFDELINDMGKLADQAIAEKRPVPPIAQLYEDAIFVNPAVRQKWLAAKSAAERSTTDAAQRAEREKAAAAAKAKSDKARKAGSSVTGAPGSGQPLNGKNPAAGGTLRSAIAAAVEDQDPVVH